MSVVKKIVNRIHLELSRREQRKEFTRLNSWVDRSANVSMDSVLLGTNKIYSGVRIGNSHLGRFTYVGSDSLIMNATIGSFCSIGPRVMIGLGNHPMDWISTHPCFYSSRGQTTKTFSSINKFDELKPITIGHDVWIGAGVTILDGLTIGTGSVLAAGAIVTKNVHPYAIVGGIPAREMKKRFSPSVAAELLDWEWWNLPDRDLAQLSILFRTNAYWTVAELKDAVQASASGTPFGSSE